MSVLSIAGIETVAGFDVLAAGQFADGYAAAENFSVGILSAEIFSAGIFAAGIFSIGIFSFGIYAGGFYAVRENVKTPEAAESE